MFSGICKLIVNFDVPLKCDVMQLLASKSAIIRETERQRPK